MKKSKEQEPYMAAGEGDDEQADIPHKKRKGWNKFWTRFKNEVSDKKK